MDEHAGSPVFEGAGSPEHRDAGEPRDQPVPLKVTITTCAYRRPKTLAAMLESIARQRFTRLPAPRIAIAIADNDPDQQGRPVCEAFRGRLPAIPLAHVPEARRGIPFARNACLDATDADSDFFVSLDDDEVPEPDWLEELLIAQAETGADVVQGRVIADFAPETPAWIRDGGFFGWPNRGFGRLLPPCRDRQELDTASTNNVLIRWPALVASGVRFDTRLALVGWDDAVFFRQVRRSGCRIVFADRARVRETIPQERGRFRYLAGLAVRGGNHRLPIKLIMGNVARGSRRALYLRVRNGLRGLGLMAESLGRLALCGARGRWDMATLARPCFLGIEGAAMVATSFGLNYEHYR